MIEKHPVPFYWSDPMTLRTPLLLALLLSTSATGIALAADAPPAPQRRASYVTTLEVLAP